MSKNLLILTADDLDLEALGINHQEPTQDDIHQLLWGVPPGAPIPPTEIQEATVGVPLDV